jgi:hypothetical protein
MCTQDFEEKLQKLIEECVNENFNEKAMDDIACTLLIEAHALIKVKHSLKEIKEGLQNELSKQNI